MLEPRVGDDLPRRRGPSLPTSPYDPDVPTPEPSSQIDQASIDAVAELTLRLTRVMRAEYVRTWLRTPNAEALDGARPVDLIARGEIGTVGRLVSGDPGAA